jgi:hypothetical protein
MIAARKLINNETDTNLIKMKEKGKRRKEKVKGGGSF